MKVTLFKTVHRSLAIIFLATFLQGCSESNDEPTTSLPAIVHETTTAVDVGTAASQENLSTLEIMQLVITPATNKLWGADNPQSDEDWAELEQAAAATIAGAALTAIGGNGPQDDEWASDPAYQALNMAMLNAAKASLEAARAKNLDALFEAGDILYPPCEACHLQFNPGVVNLPQ